MFGEFDDLSGEELTKIYNILHGQVRQSSTRVEVSRTVILVIWQVCFAWWGKYDENDVFVATVFWSILVRLLALVCTTEDYIIGKLGYFYVT